VVVAVGDVVEGVGTVVVDVAGRVVVVVDVEGPVVVGVVVVVVVEDAAGVVWPYPPKSTTCPASSAVMAAPSRPPGAEVVGSWFHDDPFHAHVSSSRAPSSPRPPKRISCGGLRAVSKAIEASSRGAGLAPKAAACDHVEPSHTQVWADSWPVARWPPNSTIVELVLS
jgi:hypothetical protein